MEYPPDGNLPPEQFPGERRDCPPPESYWIVSSRGARGAPGAPDSSRELAYLLRTPGGLVPYPREAFLQTLRPDRPVCFVIHGSYNYWPDVMRESRNSHRWIHQAAQGRPVQFVYFTWPSDGYAHVLFPVELAVMGRRCAVHAVYLANLISQFPAEQPVALVGHSHGARCVAATLHALGGGAVDDGSRLPPGTPIPSRVRAVLLAAAVDHDWLNPGEKYGSALLPIERMLVVHNPRDGWLSVYPLKNPLGNSAALGQGGLQFQDQVRLSDLAGKVTLLDASPLAGRAHDFTAFHTRTEFASAITPFVTFDDGPQPVVGTGGRGHQAASANGRQRAVVRGAKGSETAVRRATIAEELESLPEAPSPRGAVRRRSREDVAVRFDREPGSSSVQSGRPTKRSNPGSGLRSGGSPRDNRAVKSAGESTADRPKLSAPRERMPRAEFWIEPLETDLHEAGAQNPGLRTE